MKTYSPRCAKGRCENYNPHNPESKCHIYSDSRLCPKSIGHKNRMAKKSSKRDKERFQGIFIH